MAEDNELLIKISADGSQVSQAFEKLAQEAGGLESVLSSVSKVSALSFGALAAGIGLSIKAFGESEKSARNLTLALQNQGIYTDDLFRSYQAYAEEISKVTGVESAQIQNAQAILQSYLGQTAITKELTQATVDLAARMGGDLNGAAEKLGRTVGTSVNAFARQGLQLNANATQAERLSQTLEYLEVKNHGAAEAANQGVGSVKGLTTAFHELLVLIGSALAPAFTSLVHDLTLATQWTTYLADKVGSFLVSAYKTADNAVQRFGEGVVRIAQTGKLSWDQSVMDFQAAEAKRTEVGKQALNVQSADQKAAADKQAAIKAEFEQYKIQLEKATNQLLMLETQGASKELISLKQKEVATLKQLTTDKSRAELAALKQLNQEIRAEETAAAANEKRRVVDFQVEQDSAKNKAKALGIKQGLNLTKEETRDLRKEEMTQLDAEKAVYKDILKQKIDAHNRYLQEQIKYGAAFATINQAIHSNEVQGVNNATAELVQLQNSKNSTLKDIGKVAATAQIIIKTAESAMNIYEGFSEIPIVGPALGIAAAAAAIAYGAEQLGNVQSAASGGLVEGGIPGKDSVPFLLEPGELVVPKRNFNDVVGAVQGSGPSNRDAEILDTLKSIEEKTSAKVVIQGSVHTDKAFVDTMVRRISDAVQFRNAKIFGVTQ